MKAEFSSPSVFAPSRRRSMNLVAVCLNIFLPWFLFSTLYAVMSFTMHYSKPTLSWMLVVAGFGVALLTATLAWRAKNRDRDPMWYVYAALAFFLAVCLAAMFGDMNFWYNMQPFYDVENLNTYPSVNPAREKGQQLMDAGRVYFADGTGLDMKKAMGFKNLDLYCVAPIVNGNAQLASYDFWAVGINCCSGVSSDFRCVQQAEAAYNLKATHPLFFYWMQDPVAEMNSYRDDGFKYYLIGVFTYFAFNTFCVVCAVIGFSKIGRY